MTSIAIAIPSLNGAKYLRETLRSIEMQTVKPDEVIISDNHSSDDSIAIIQTYTNLNIKLISPATFVSMSKNWNFAASHVQSDWFIMLSNDDLLRNTAILKLKEIISNIPDNIGVISCKSEIIDEKSKLLFGKYKVGRARFRSEFDFLKENIRYLHINAASVAIKTQAWRGVGKFPENYDYIHDLVFYQRMILQFGILESKEVIARYRTYLIRAGSDLRTRQTEDDFSIYENTDLKFYISRYPQLEVVYNSEKFAKSSKQTVKPKIKQLWRMAVISVMSGFRRLEGIMHKSGFPSNF